MNLQVGHFHRQFRNLRRHIASLDFLTKSKRIGKIYMYEFAINQEPLTLIFIILYTVNSTPIYKYVSLWKTNFNKVLKIKLML